MPLVLRDIAKTFGAVAAVDGVSLDIDDGRFFSLLGPSGCGKTTILRMLAGIIRPDRGLILLGARDITDLPVHARNMTLVFQNYALFPHLTVFDNVAFGLEMRGEKLPAIRQRVEAALELVRLPGFGDRYPGQISGGQQQRVALARALVVHPEVLLLDEPLSNLDAKLREEMRVELRDIQRKIGITTILVTHDIHEAFALSDRIAVMNQGRIEQVGTPADLYRRPATRFVAEFAGRANHFEGKVRGIQSGVATIDLDQGATIAVSADDLTPGTSAVVMVRPERIRLDGARGANRLAARVVHATYLGGVVAYVLDANGRRLIAEASTTSDELLAPGAPVEVSWAEADGVVLRRG